MRRAPEWTLAGWVGPPVAPIDPAAPLAALGGRVVLLHAFQIGCRGCREHGLPQAERVWHSALEGPLAGAPLVVVGLHTPFDPSEPAGDAARGAIEAWARAAGWRQPLALDAPGPPGELGTATFRAYRMQGTPTLCLIDARGVLRRQHLGPMPDLWLGVELGLLLAEAGATAGGRPSAPPESG